MGNKKGIGPKVLWREDLLESSHLEDGEENN
jgi:hypothetical protein